MNLGLHSKGLEAYFAAFLRKRTAVTVSGMASKAMVSAKDHMRRT